MSNLLLVQRRSQHFPMCVLPMSFVENNGIFDQNPLQAAQISILLGRRLALDGVALLCQHNGLQVSKVSSHAALQEMKMLLETSDVLMIGLDELMAMEWRPNGKKLTARRVIVLGDLDQRQQLKYWWNKHVGGIVVNQDRFTEIRKVIEDVISGNRSHTRLLDFDSACGTTGGDHLLTRRQVEVLRLVSEGNSSKEIGTRLSISHKTVENHRATIYQRLGVRTAAEMVNVARRTGWL